MTQKFTTFKDFYSKFPLDEITVPVGIQSPDSEGPYWLIQLALPMKNKVVNCHVYNATSNEIINYKKRSLSMLKHALQISYGDLIND